MKILFLGTGAADWSLCERTDGNEYRRNSSVLIDDKILIDPGPQAYEAACEFGVKISSVKYILNTHKHVDHFCLSTLDSFMKQGAEYLEINAGEIYQIENYTIQAFEGNHRCKTLHYLIFDGKSRFFYGLDGAWLMYEEIQAIKKDIVDLAIVDGTVGDIEGDYRIFEHNNLRMVKEMKKSLETYIRRFCISHMAYTLHGTHEQLDQEMRKFGIEVAYDGLQIEI